jgi:hypothetical protein
MIYSDNPIDQYPIGEFIESRRFRAVMRREIPSDFVLSHLLCSHLTTTILTAPTTLGIQLLAL